MTKHQLQRFDDFWNAWPKKVARRDAEKAWEKEGCDEKADVVIEAVKRQLRTIWSGKEPKFIPYPATWLRGHRWQDELLSPTAPVAAAAQPVAHLAPPFHGDRFDVVANLAFLQIALKTGGTLSESLIVRFQRIRDELAALCRECPDEYSNEHFAESLKKRWRAAYAESRAA